MQNAAESILDYLVAEHTLHNNTKFQKIAGSILTASIMLFIIELDSVKWKEHNDECFYPLFVWTANVLLFGDNPRALDLTRKVSRVAMEDLKDQIHFWARACAKYTCKMLMCSLCCHKFVCCSRERWLCHLSGSTSSEETMVLVETIT